jgi:hypothetical protein
MKAQVNWTEKVNRWKLSGKTQREYCRDEGLSYWTFREKLKKEKVSGFVQVKSRRVPALTNNEIIELVINGKVQITIHHGYSRELLQSVFADLGVSG